MLPIFDLKPLKKEFYSKLILALAIGLAGWGITATGIIPTLTALSGKTSFFILFAIFFAFQTWHNKQIKKILEIAIEEPDMDEKFRIYIQYYTKKLFYSVGDVAINSIFFIITLNTWFLYINLIPFVFLLASFPRKAIISMELKNEDIEFIG